ncbi:DUF4097 family beta strand repeat protein [Algoriphagus aestuariicola]|jgi:hypothetical protein|uniref:DUF4097 family beta strand repeat protein n=1 Tax=Algoriphagus aestuariicola TaxID=1852016 RepID=A0ABS3BL89_9BACT|nr:DUF4097 family beta strand repeat-containing protein [Algoriphagus aestuariicola]MBN7799594.1 DUF4097 family beta strand repeat protein [Algoriphagus aestuariicola]
MNTLLKKSSLALTLMLLSIAAFAQNVLVDSKKSYPGIKRIEIESGWLNVNYKGGTSSDVHVEAYLESNNTEQDIVFVTVGDVLKISHTRKQNNYNWNTKNKGYLNITGPEGIALDVRGSSGNVVIDKISSDKTSLRVSSGNVTATNINGDLSIGATSGNLTADGVTGHVSAGVTSGNGNFYRIKGNLDYQSTSGSLDADGVEGEINVKLTSGNAKINNSGTLGMLQFTSGNVRASNVGLGPNTKFSGTSGNFRVQTNSDLKAYNFSLKASSGNLKVGSINTGKTLEIDNGSSSWIRGNISSGNITIEN